MKTEPQTRMYAGMFADRAGPDGTSIWAAATSGQGAIAAHLLASMLARIWKAPEAISLWVELVERRKQHIYKTFDTTNMIGTSAIMAAQQLFNRQQLSSWDSSARAWLQTADTAKRLQHTQLMLIINNVRLAVNAKTDPYESVIKAWTSALVAMENLVCRIPQRVQDGSILLAISSWHLFPDMQVLADEVRDIEQKDELMKGSLLTISSYGATTEKDGVFWPLPLSRMRYYSPPVVAERQLSSETSRVSLLEFQIVVLGAVISPWNSICPDQERCCRFISNVLECTKRSQQAPPPWLDILAGAAVKYTESQGTQRDQYTKLLRLGMRRYRTFLNGPAVSPRLFGLEYVDVLLSIHANIEHQISILRQLAEERKLQGQDLLIRYVLPDHQRVHDRTIHAFASVFPTKRPSTKIETEVMAHYRFIIGQYVTPLVYHAVNQCSCATNGVGCDRDHGARLSTCSYRDPRVSFERSGFRDEDHIFYCAGCLDKLRQVKVEEESGEECRLIHPNTFSSYAEGEFLIKSPGESFFSSYSLFLGNVENTVAIYRRNLEFNTLNSTPAQPSEHSRPSVTMDEIEATMASHSFSPRHLCQHLYSWWKLWPRYEEAQKHCLSLNVVTFATSLYSAMPDATISLEVVKSSLYDIKLAQRLKPAGLNSNTGEKMRQELNGTTKKNPGSFEDILAKSFACIAYFESGGFDMAPIDLRGVMALSCGDSINVASALLADPSTKTRDCPIKRVFGNIGRSEMALLIPPASPEFQKPNLDAWNLINHSPFDGQFPDSFTSTSLHLTFTDYEVPLTVGTRGLRDPEVILVEAVVSIDDRGKRIGDLDILGMFNSDKFLSMRSCSHGSEPADENDLEELQQEYKCELISLDCWDEFLDPPVQSVGIFRTTGNWQARLGAAAACIQAGKIVLILPSPCMKCVKLMNEIENWDFIVA